MMEWHEVAQRGDVSEGCPRSVTVGSTKIGLFVVDGEVHAINNVCTHAYALLTNGFQEGCLVECPLHAGFFDIRTGAAQGAPVEVDVATYPVEVRDGVVFVAIDTAGQA
ncbi:nitrite reductase/ring-hydroxylating ferredoxin subunit [Novosphingobium sp. 1529]|uniref:non-heme iron oxygenase ferredoxin subunit n=1 Tax=Novosphingobium sp. 1529 TaxID=3156424 RepID=UPI001C12CCA6